MTPLYIFDLDGTLALNGHRQHLLAPVCSTCCTPKDGDGPKVCQSCGGPVGPDWRAFFAACVHDSPNWQVISTLYALIRSGADVQIWSGRSAEVMNETVAWLQKYLPGDLDLDELQLLMRREGDFTPDEKLKEGWLLGLNEFDRKRLVAVFDDRQKVVDMWRRNGVACFQVAPGDF